MAILAVRKEQLNKQLKSLPYETSHTQVIEELRRWRAVTLTQLDTMCERILTDMSSTFDDVHQFAAFTDGLLVEQQRQLERATSDAEFDIIQARLNIITNEIQLLQCHSFRLDCNSVKLNGELSVICKHNEIQSFLSTSESSRLSNDFQAIPYSSDTSSAEERSPTPSNNNSYKIYRLLVSRADAIELDKNAIPNFHLSSYANELIGESVLTIDVPDLDLFLDAFDSYVTILPNNHDIRLLIPQQYVPLIMGELGKTARLFERCFNIDHIKVFSTSCPKSNERVLLLQGKQLDAIKTCIREIYYRIEVSNIHCKTIPYNPAHLLATEIDEMATTAANYGGLAMKQQQHRERTRSSRTDSTTVDDETKKKIDEHLIKDTDTTSSSDDENNGDNNSWAEFRHVRGNDPEAICREIAVNDVQAGVIIGVNATRIDLLKKKTGAYIYVRGDSNDPKRTVFIKGTRDQVERAAKSIENLIEKHKNDKLPMKQRRARGKNRAK